MSTETVESTAASPADLVPPGPWQAFVHDEYGFVHEDPDEALREIFADEQGGKITVCCGTALPHDRDGGQRLEGTYTSSDIFIEIDLSDYEEYEQGVEAWKRAQAATDGLNRMAASEVALVRPEPAKAEEETPA